MLTPEYCNTTAFERKLQFLIFFENYLNISKTIFFLYRGLVSMGSWVPRNPLILTNGLGNPSFFVQKLRDKPLGRSLMCISNNSFLTLFYMGFWIYVNTVGGGGSKRPPLAKCFLRQPICMEMTQNGSQCKILVFSYPYIPKTAFFDDYFSRERSRKELGY